MLKQFWMPFAALFFCGLVHAAVGPNVVVNGGFESGVDAWKPGSPPESWSMDKADTLMPGELVIDTQVRRSGRASVRISNSTHGIYQRIPVTPGQLYNARFWTKSKLTSGGFGLHIFWLDAQGKWVANARGQQITHGANVYSITDWREVRIDNVRAPDTAVQAQLTTISIIDADHHMVEGEYWIDDVSMTIAPADHSKDQYRATARIQPARGAPVIDGKLDDPAWTKSTAIGSFTRQKDKTVSPLQTSAAITYDHDALYLGIVALGPKPGSAGWDDIFEIMLQKKRFAFNVKGEIDSKQSAGWQVAIQPENKAWVAEVRIPFTSLGITSPKPGDIWDFNIVRHHAADNKTSSWAPGDPGGIGSLVFGSRNAHAGDAAFSPMEVSVEIINSTDKPAKAVARINRQDGGVYWQYADAQVSLAPGESRQILLPAINEDDPGFSWLSVEADGQLLLREGCIPQKEYAAVDWNDPLNVLGRRLYIANDLPTYKPIQTNHNFPGGIAGPQLIERDQRPVDLIVELPEGFRATHVVQFLNNWRWWNPVEPAEVRSISDGGRKMRQYRFELPCILNNSENSTMVFFETDLPAGTHAAGKCFLQWDTGRQPSQPLDIEVITVGRMPPFKRLFNGIYYAEAELLLTWLPEIGRDYPTLGLNRVEIDPDPGSGGAQGGAGKGPSRRHWFDRLVKQARSGGLYMASSPSQSTPWAQNWMAADPSARALDINGEPIMDYGNPSLCPLYRGHKFQEHIDKLTTGPAFNEYGLTWLAIDLELWSDEAWAKGCYCPRCLEAYPKFMNDHHPDATPGDPRLFMKDPEANRVQAAYWKEFRRWSKNDFIRSFRTPLIECIKKHGQTSGPRPGLLVSEWLFPTKSLFDVVDYFEVNCYRKPAEVARRLGIALQTSDGRKNIVAAQGFGQTYGLDAMLTPQDMIDSIHEAAAAGVQGMVWYDATSLDALKLKTLVDACRSIQPFEDIIVDGTCTVTIPTTPEPASARQIKLNDEALLIVRNYGGTAAATAEVSLPESLTSDLVVYDVQTLQQLVTSGQNTNKINVPLEPDQARLLYIGPDQKWQLRTAK